MFPFYRLQVHVQPDVQGLQLCSGGGNITLFLTHGIRASLLFPKTAQLSLPAELQVSTQPEEVGPGLLALHLHPSGGQEGGHGGIPLSRLQAAQQAACSDVQALSNQGESAFPVIELQPGKARALRFCGLRCAFAAATARANAFCILRPAGSGRMVVELSSWMESVRRKINRGK